MHFTKLAPRRLATIAAALGASGTAALMPALSTGSANAAGRIASVPRCASSGLVVWLNTQGNGAAGSVYYQLQLTNLSGHTCMLRGYPGVSAIGLSGRQLGSAARREPGLPAKTVTLADGATATATLRISDIGVFTPSDCRSTTAAGLRVYAPNQRASKLVPFPFEACSHTGPRYLSVGPVRSAP